MKWLWFVAYAFTFPSFLIGLLGGFGKEGEDAAFQFALILIPFALALLVYLGLEYAKS